MTKEKKMAQCDKFRKAIDANHFLKQLGIYLKHKPKNTKYPKKKKKIPCCF